LRKSAVGLIILGLIILIQSPFVITNQQLQLIISPHKLFINQEQVQPAIPLLNYGGETYVPLRYIVDKMGGNTGFNSEEGTISVLFDKTDAIKDQKHINVSLAGLVLTKKDTSTLVNGKILIDNGPTIESYNEVGIHINLTFYNKENQVLGNITKYIDNIKKGQITDIELSVNGDITSYSRASLNVEYLGPRIARGTTQPRPELTIDENKISLVDASHCWYNGCADSAPAIQLVKNLTPVEVEPGAQININYNYEPNPTLKFYYLWDENQNRSYENIENNIITVPNNKGKYVYLLKGVWQLTPGTTLAESGHAFIIDVK